VIILTGENKMAKIPSKNHLQKLFESGSIPNQHRPYLGYSELGKTCDRYLYYKLRWCFSETISRRVQRIFTRGDLEEPRIHAEFKRIGLEIINDQKEVIGAHKHILGHIDGEVKNLPDPSVEKDEVVLVEVKTMNNKRYNTYLNKGLKLSDPQYYSQINSYMGKLGHKKCLFIVHNKDNEERSYILYDFDKDEFDRIEKRAFDILYAEFLPKKIGEATWFECKFCSASPICHKGAEIEKNCRTCKFVSIAEEGNWECEHPIMPNVKLTHDHQRVGCGSWELDPMFEE